MNYQYDGAISPQTCNCVKSMMKEYPNPIELSSVPKILDILPEHPSIGEDCMGQSYQKMSRQYGIVYKNFHDQAAGLFLFLRSKEEYEIILSKCSELVVNANPFRTIL